jgi:hypothetical protein
LPGGALNRGSALVLVTTQILKSLASSFPQAPMPAKQKGTHTMKAEVFYQKIVAVAAQSPAERRSSLVDLHTVVMTPYLNAVRAMTAQDAARVSSDRRTIAQVVGHIAEWERYTILAVGEIITGVRWPQIMNMSGYIEPDGQVREFTGVDAFNDYQAARHAAWSWDQIQDLAIQTAVTLQVLFAHPSLVSWEHLDQAKVHNWRLPNEMSLTMSCGWFLWMVTLEHEAVEHTADLGIVDI